MINVLRLFQVVVVIDAAFVSMATADAVILVTVVMVTVVTIIVVIVTLYVANIVVVFHCCYGNGG